MKRLLSLLSMLIAFSLLPLSAQAWWNADWKYRKKITLDTTAQAADLKEAVGPAPVAVRLHSGNFLFTDAKPDGSDIRFVAGDGKTPLKHHVELFDAGNQLAILWVQVPRLPAASASEFFWLYSGNEKAVSADDTRGVYGDRELLRLGFAGPGRAFVDSSAYAHPLAADGVEASEAGFAGRGAVFTGAPLRIAAVPAARVIANAPDAGASFSAWVRPEGRQRAQLFSWGPFSVSLADGALSAAFGRATASGGALREGEWNHVAVSVSSRLALYVNGVEVASQEAALVDLAGEMQLGSGYRGAMDVVSVAAEARSAAWFRAEAAQGIDGRLLVHGEPEVVDAAAGHGYIAVLFNSLTVDAIVVIVILAGMFVVAMYVMASKALMLARTDRGNADFIDEFESRPDEYLDPARPPPPALGNGRLRHSSLARLYQTGMQELRRRLNGELRGGLKAEAVAAIRASMDSTLIREMQRLNRSMVLLTIAISGGPFLGLLGTVVGVMITFASVAAAGDVSIAVVAPGMAAALLATAAGLAVAIPALFGYNYLLTRIKGITADMRAFSDEFVTRMAERH
jgi:biopolymer transport protein ExbB